MASIGSKLRTLLPPCRLALAVLAAVVSGRPSAGAEHLNEYQLKAAFLFNLTRFVEWPAEAFASPDDPLTACVLGKGDVEDVLRQAVGRKAAGRVFAIRHITDAQEAAGCHIMFVNESVGRRWLSLSHIKSIGILTVGETDDFISEGGAVNLRLQDDNIRIQVNLESARRARLEMSSKLLGLAEILKK